MEHKTVTLAGFSVAGIEVRTSNRDAMKDIPPLWQRFYGEGVQAKIPEKIDGDIVALYTDYEGDHTKPYTLLVGCKTNSAQSLPEGISYRNVPAAKYEVFNAKGKMPDIVVSTWQYVWGSDLERTYTGDFEIYGKNSADPENAEVEIYIAVK
jgi:predicted transcriptional regulator YdeE